MHPCRVGCPLVGRAADPLLKVEVAGEARELHSQPLSPPSPCTGHPFHPGESAPGQNQQDFCPLPAARLALLWFRSLQDSGYCLPGMSGSMAALPRQGIIILTYVLAALELTCLFMQFSILPVSNTHTPHQKPHTAFLLGNGRE